MNRHLPAENSADQSKESECTMDRNKDLDALESSTVYDSENRKVGPVGQIYLDGRTNEPKFVTVNTGLFGTKETFVPYEAVNHTADGLSVPFTKDFIKDAPNIDADGPLVAEDQQRIFDYYQSRSETAAGAQTQGHQAAGGTTQGSQTQGRQTQGSPTQEPQTQGFQNQGRQTQGEQGHGHQAPGHQAPGHQRGNAAEVGTDAPSVGTDATRNVDSEAQVTAHEERLNVGTERHATDQVRLRKRVRTEHRYVEVPVQREELVVEREEIDPDSPEARNTGGITGEANAAEETVTLHEERPVVDKETVAAEKVHVGKRTVQDTETVEGDLRREEIDVEDQERPETRR